MVRRAHGATLDGGRWLREPLSLAPRRRTDDRRLLPRYKSLPAARAAQLLDHVADADRQRTAATRPRRTELWMTWEMAREMRDGGMTIGGHTVMHPLLARVSPERQQAEIAGCAERLEARAGRADALLRLPRRRARRVHATTTQQLLRRAASSWRSASTAASGASTRWNPLDVPRVHVAPGYGSPLLHAALSLPQLFARW